MSVDARSILNHQATDADHRTFAQAIHDMLLAVGLTQTADTGQANLATLTRPAATNVSGYEIFRFNDTEQATRGVFVKVEYGSGPTNTIPGLRITSGTGTNGAGTLTAASSDMSICAWSATVDGVGTTRPAFASYAEGQLVVVFGQDVTVAQRIVFHYFGRPRSTSGARTTDGLFLCKKAGSFNTGKSHHWQIQSATGGTGVDAGLPINTAFAAGGLDDQVGADTALFPIVIAVGAAVRFTSLFSYRFSAFAANAQDSVTVFGGAKNYRTLGNAWQQSDAGIAVPYL